MPHSVSLTNFYLKHRGGGFLEPTSGPPGPPSQPPSLPFSAAEKWGQGAKELSCSGGRDRLLLPRSCQPGLTFPWLEAEGLHPSPRSVRGRVGGFFRVAGAPCLLAATCSGSIPGPGSLEGVEDIPILPQPCGCHRGGGRNCSRPAAPGFDPLFSSAPRGPSHTLEATEDPGMVWSSFQRTRRPN